MIETSRCHRVGVRQTVPPRGSEPAGSPGSPPPPLVKRPDRCEGLRWAAEPASTRSDRREAARRVPACLTRGVRRDRRGEDEVVIALVPSGERWVGRTDGGAVDAVVARRQGTAPALIVLEATGGLTAALVALL